MHDHSELGSFIEVTASSADSASGNPLVGGLLLMAGIVALIVVAVVIYNKKCKEN